MTKTTTVHKQLQAMSVSVDRPSFKLPDKEPEPVLGNIIISEHKITKSKVPAKPNKPVLRTNHANQRVGSTTPRKQKRRDSSHSRTRETVQVETNITVVHQEPLAPLKPILKAPKSDADKPISNNQLKKQMVREFRNKRKALAKQGKSIYDTADARPARSIISSLVLEKSTSEPTKTVAIDCEMVGVGPRGSKDMLARVSIVNLFGHTLYDKFVQPMETVTDYRTFVSGITPTDLRNGEDFRVVQKEVCDLLKGRVLVGHAIKNDLKVLFLEHPAKDIRDTSKYFKADVYGGHGTPSLRRLAQHLIGVTIQGKAHCSVEDARATMRLYTMFKKEWESEINARFRKKYGDASDWALPPLDSTSKPSSSKA